MLTTWAGWRAQLSQLIRRCWRLLSFGFYAGPPLQPVSISVYLRGLISNLCHWETGKCFNKHSTFEFRLSSHWFNVFLIVLSAFRRKLFFFLHQLISNPPPPAQTRLTYRTNKTSKTATWYIIIWKYNTIMPVSVFCNKKKCVNHFHLWWWTCWTAAWNLFSNDMFYHTLCQSEVFTPHTHSDTPDTHLYTTLSQKKHLPWFTCRTANRELFSGINWSQWGGDLGPETSRNLTSVCVTLHTNAGGWHPRLTWSVAAALTQVYRLLLRQKCCLF